MSVGTPEFDEEWRYEGWINDEDDAAMKGAVDSDGNLILAGFQGFETRPSVYDDTFTNILSSEFAAVKLLGASGAVVWYWTDQSSGDGEQIDIIFGADTDSNNDVILAGFTTGFWTATNTYGGRHVAVVKLDGSTGEEIWRFQDAAEDSYTTLSVFVYLGWTTVTGVAVDHDDNVFLVGRTTNSLVYGEGSPDDLDYFTMKLSGATGVKIFTVQQGSSYHWDALYDVKVDSSGDVVAAGTSGLDDQTDFLVVKLSGTDGSLLWEYSPYSFTIDVFYAIDLDDQDDVYVVGREGAQNGQGGIADSPVVTKLSGTDGSLIWTYSGTSSSWTTFEGVAVDPTTGWVVAAGYTEGTWLTGATQGGYDFAAVALDRNTGEELVRYQNGTDGGDFILFAEFDSAGALLVGGYTFDVSGELDFLAVKLSTGSTPASTLASTSSDEWKPVVISVAAGVLLVIILLALGLVCLCRKRVQDKPPPTSVAQVSDSGQLPAKVAIPLQPPVYATPIPFSQPLPKAGTVVTIAVRRELPPSYDENINKDT